MMFGLQECTACSCLSAAKLPRSLSPTAVWVGLPRSQREPDHPLPRAAGSRCGSREPRIRVPFTSTKQVAYATFNIPALLLLKMYRHVIFIELVLFLRIFYAEQIRKPRK